MTTSRFIRRLATLTASAAFLTGIAMAAPMEPEDPDGGIKVKEVFEVGPDVYVRALKIEEETDTLWVGTSAGVNEVELSSGRLRNSFSRKDGLANEYVFAIGIDQEGYKWFGTNAGGTSRYRDGQWKTYFPMHGLADYWVYAFANQKDGTVWIGTWAGANSFDMKTGTFKTYVKELINEWVYGISVDAQNRVWFATEGGVSLYDGKSWKSWSHKDGLGAANVDNLPASVNTGLGTRSRHDLNTLLEGNPTYNPSYVFSILVAKDGGTWAGTWGGGVGRFGGQQWTNFSTRDGLAGNIVYSIAEDADGILWFGTDHGLSRYDGKTWRNFTRTEGLLDNNVYAVATAPGGDLWVGTRRGVARIGQ